MRPHMPHPPHPPPFPHRGERQTRWSLPLHEHPVLDLQTDMARVSVVGIAPGQAPWLEVTSHHHEPTGANVDVDASGGTTRVHISGIGHLDSTWWNGLWWEAAFWDSRFWKKAFRVSLVLHVPRDVRGRLRLNAAKMRVENLSGCDLAIDADAGSLDIEDVEGTLKLATQAGRIEAVRIGGTLDISTSAGSVRAEITSLSPGTHRIRTNVGAVRLELARGMPVRIAARTTMGATRIDFPTTDDAPALLDIEADLGAIRVTSASRSYDSRAAVPAGPYRTAASPAEGGSPVPQTSSALAPSSDEEIESILQRVADGSITPEAARESLASARRDVGINPQYGLSVPADACGCGWP